MLNNIFKRVIRLSVQKRRVVVLLILFILVPIVINIYIIYSRTIEVVKSEKIEVTRNVLKKTIETMELKLIDISKSVSEFSDNLGIGASIAKYKTVASNYQVKIDNHIFEKLNEIVDNNFYIDDAVCFTKGGKVYTAKGVVKFNDDLLKEGLKYKNKISSKNEDVFFNTDIVTEQEVDEKGILFMKSIYHIPPDNTNVTIKDNLVKKDPINEVGYVFAYVNKDKLLDLYNYGNTSLVKDNQIAIYDQDFNHIIGSTTIDVPPSTIADNLNNGQSLNMKEVEIDNQRIVLGISNIEPIKWYLVNSVPVNSLIGSTRSGLRETLFVLGVISVIVSLVIIFQTLQFSETVVEKEMTDYRLAVSEEVNEKLRLYKHDFMNHLQIIQGLLQMNCSDRAIEYLKSVAKEGFSINKNYEIGIPELEVTLNTIMNKAKEKNIEVDIEVSRITKDLPLSTNELVKIIMNLADNAMFALVNSEEDHKLLKIKITNDLGNYIFEVCNNTPIIPATIRSEIFKKGFSTKGDRGNGLGLYIVKKVLKKYEGKIELIIDEEGNHFIVTIPECKELSTVRN